MKKLSIYITSDTTTDYLAKFISENNATIECKIAPYNQVIQVLLSEAKSNILLIWSCPDKQISQYKKLIEFEKVDINEIYKEIEQYSLLIKQAAKKYKTIFMLSWSFPPEKFWPLGLAHKSNSGCINVLNRMNIYLSDLLCNVKNFHLIDSSILESKYKGNLHDPRLYAIGKIRYSINYQTYLGGKVLPLINATIKSSRKLIICDLDDTLWGGIIGDDGINGIKIGGNEPIGEAHLELQILLKSLKNRGIILAISSKNNEETVLNAFANNPNMLLKISDFSSMKINWEDKAINVSVILKELNLLPSSAIFLDDNPSERERVKKSFPEIIVPNLPKDVSLWSDIINNLNCFETLNISSEDLQRTELYINENKRKKISENFIDINDWLNSLEIELLVEVLSKKNISRAAQLLNKSNQFNLKTRRLSEEELLKWLSPNWRYGLTFSVKDKFGDSGLTALVTIENNEKRTRIVDFVMSCRIMGKRIEHAILCEINLFLETSNPIEVICLPTPKNNPMKTFILKNAPNGFLQKINSPKHIKILREY